jgi:hypothetical protein
MLNKELLFSSFGTELSIDGVLICERTYTPPGYYWGGTTNITVPWITSTDIYYEDYRECLLYMRGSIKMTGWHRVIFGAPISASTSWVPIKENEDKLYVGSYFSNGEEAPIFSSAGTLAYHYLDVMHDRMELLYTEPSQDSLRHFYTSLGSGIVEVPVTYQFRDTPP